MTITLAFYKAKGNYADYLIRWWTKSKYSHVEMIIDDNWVSSNPLAGGVTIYPLRELSKDYEYINVTVDGRKLSKVKKFIEENAEAEYDWWGLVLGTILRTEAEDKNKFFCSEMMTIILQIFDEIEVEGLIPSNTTPEDLWKVYQV